MARRQMNRDYVRDVFREAVLKGLDLATRQTFDPPQTNAGATDADLPRLFKAIDAQVDRLADRFGVILTDRPQI